MQGQPQLHSETLALKQEKIRTLILGKSVSNGNYQKVERVMWGGAGEMAQSALHLLCKYWSLSLNPRKPGGHNSLPDWYPQTWGTGREDRLIPRTHWPNSLVNQGRHLMLIPDLQMGSAYTWM